MDFYYEMIPALIVLTGSVIAWFAIARISSLRRQNYPEWRKRAEGTLLWLVALAAVFLAGSSAFNAVALHHFRATHSPPGETYLVAGHAMHIRCMGSGSPTLVLDAGLGNDDLIWSGVQPTLAETTRVCSYDRAGFGWSDRLREPRDAGHIAAELHGLLATAKIDGPVVLMGHSIAGLYEREYATRYPNEVAGLVFVDGSTPLQDRNAAMRALDQNGPPLWIQRLVSQFIFSAGIPRLFGACSRSFPGFDAAAAKLQAEDRCHPQLGAIAAERASFDRSGEETVQTGPYGALPILILSQDPGKEAAQGAASVAQAWDQMQENLKKLSTQSQRIIARGSSHYIQLDRQDLIEKEVPLFLGQIRGTTPQPRDYGATVTE
jgi:pimeloyl-ACP methyl ester carboxylesterase